jgi:hypothetical protein
MEKEASYGPALVWGCALEERRCLACRKLFKPYPHVKHQSYCSKPECQKERKRRWHKQKLLDDPEYKNDRRDARRKWRLNNPDYWRRYRESHSDYVKKNRAQQRQRNARRRERSSPIAKTDASEPGIPLVSGIYDLIPSSGDMIAKMDVIRAEIRFISRC